MYDISGNPFYLYFVHRTTVSGERSKANCSLVPGLYTFFDLEKLLTYCDISIITEDVCLKLGVGVHYPKSNPYYRGRQFKMHFLPE